MYFCSSLSFFVFFFALFLLVMIYVINKQINTEVIDGLRQAWRRLSHSELSASGMHCDCMVQVLVAVHQPQLNTASMERH